MLIWDVLGMLDRRLKAHLLQIQKPVDRATQLTSGGREKTEQFLRSPPATHVDSEFQGLLMETNSGYVVDQSIDYGRHDSRCNSRKYINTSRPDYLARRRGDQLY